MLFPPTELGSSQLPGVDSSLFESKPTEEKQPDDSVSSAKEEKVPPLEVSISKQATSENSSHKHREKKKKKKKVKHKHKHRHKHDKPVKEKSHSSGGSSAQHSTKMPASTNSPKHA